MRKSPSIYFLCPDIDIPSGGINRIYRLAKITCEAGFDACVLHGKEGFKNRWSPVMPPVRYWQNGLHLKAGDLVIIPETEPIAMKQLPEGVHKIVLALSWSYIFENLPKGNRWADYGVRQVITHSSVVESFVRWTMDLPVHRITGAIDHSRFYYDRNLKQPTIVFMAHRNNHGEIVKEIISRQPQRDKEWNWVGIRDLTTDEYAAVMRKASIFISTGLREAFPGPILEAMAAGTLVVGYGGVGGNEYLVPSGDRQNAYQVENHDYPELCRVLCDVIDKLKRQEPSIERIRQNALNTAKPLTPDSEKDSVLALWRTILK